MRRRSGWVLDRLGLRAPDQGARPAPVPARGGAARGQHARLPRPAGTNAGPRPVTGSGCGWQDLPRGPPRLRHPSPPARRRRTRRAPAGSPRGRCQAQQGQPLHCAPGTPGPGRRRGDLRCPAYSASAAWTSPERQAIKITRRRQDTATARASRQTVCAVTRLTSAQATAPDLADLVREHWSIGVHHQHQDVQRSYRHQPHRQRPGKPGHHPRHHQRRRLPKRPRRPAGPHHPRRSSPPPRH